MLRRYEAMYLFDSAGAREWASIEQEVRRLCDRIGAELLVCVKFDERRLAYEIDRRKRGTYVLTYMDAPVDRIGDLERDARLSELILRLLVLRADHISAERIAELQEHTPEVALSPASEGRRHEDERYGHFDRRGGRSGPRPPETAPQAPEEGPAQETPPATAPVLGDESAEPESEASALDPEEG